MRTLLVLIQLLVADRHRLLAENLALRHHQSLDRNAPIPRDVESVGEVCAKPVLGGLHHRYFRAA